MPSQYPYRATIHNEYLGVSKVIRAMSRNELEWLIDAQREKWAEQEKRKRQARKKETARAAARRETENLKAQAEDDTEAAQQLIETFRSILTSGLGIDLRIVWERLLDRRSFPPFEFNLPKPDRDAIRLELLGPQPTQRHVPRPKKEKPSWWEWIFEYLQDKRLEREEEAEEEYREAVKEAREEFARKTAKYEAREGEVVAAYNSAAQVYSAQFQAKGARYTQERDAFLAHQQAHNNAITEFRSRYEAGSAEAVERYVQMVLEKSSYPEGIPGEPDVLFNAPSKMLIVAFWLPCPAGLPNVEGYKFVASRKEIMPIEMKPKDTATFYDDVIHQIALRTVHEIVVADYAAQVEAVVFNGWVRGIDPKTGKAFTSCILSYEAPRQRFLELDLARVSPRECVRGFKGLTAGPLSMLAPVRPIMDINRDDDRFVDSKEVLGQMQAGDNLAAMEWEDFEHLVRELFEKVFAEAGGEVRVTQASRDRGVDAVVFDPDPIRGGKIIIQAKRYNMVVPVSAVRDLYGTVHAEGAIKGILVTTSHFGRDSWEFAKDKPLTLLDGENLIYMFQKHGHNVHISMLPKGDPRRGV